MSRMLVVVCVAFALLSSTEAYAQNTPAIDRPVEDVAGVVDDEHQRRIEAELRAHYERTGVQMAVLVIDTTRGEPIEDFAARVATSWGGGRAGEDRGVLLALAVEDRRSRLEVGYGLEAVLPDAMAARILVDMRRPLRAKNYAAAIDLAADRVIDRTENLTPGEPAGVFDTNLLWNPATGFWLILFLGWIVAGVPMWMCDRDIGPFSDARGPLLGLALVVLAGGMVMGLARDIAALGYLLVFGVGLLFGLVTVRIDSWKRWSPLVVTIVYGSLWAFAPGVLDFGYSELTDQLILDAIFLGGGGMLLMGVGHRGYGSSYSSSGSSRYSRSSSSSSSSSSGGYSGGGGSFGGGGASGGW